MGKQIGIMGGTFNPIHNAHLAMAQDALEQFHLDEIVFIPSGTPYLKKTSEVLTGQIRLEMVQLAISDNEKFSLSNIEIEREGNTYTCETIAELRKKNPENTYYFIVGADSFFYMENWYHPEEIFGKVILLVAVRDLVTEEKLNEKILELREKYQCQIEFLRIQATELSSTYLRKCVKDGRSIQYYVPKQVNQFIKDKGLYL